MEKERITGFLSEIIIKLEESNQSYDPVWRLRGLLDHSTRLLERLRSRKPQRDNNITIQLIEDFQELSTKLYKHLFDLLEISENIEEDTKTVRGHQLVNKLSKELRYIETLAAAVLENDNYYISEGDENLSWFDNVVSLAANDLDVDTNSLLILFNLNQTLGLRSFTYTREFKTLDVPITVLYTPWEWSVIWHEIAGIKVKQIKKRIPEFIKDVFSVVRPRLQNRSDWTEGHLEEIFEDACSVLVFGEEFLPVFEKVLRRTYAQPISKDSRHPPVSTRINLAKLLLGQNPEDATQDQKEVALEIINQMSDYLPNQKGMFDPGDPHSILMNAIREYKRSPQDGFNIFQLARSAFENPVLTIPNIGRTAKQESLKQIEPHIDPNSFFIEIGRIRFVLFDQAAELATKIQELLDIEFSESDFMSPAEHRDDPSHSNKVKVVYPSIHGDHTHNHKH